MYTQIIHTDQCACSEFSLIDFLKNQGKRNYVIENSVNNKEDNILYRIPVKFWIFRMSNGTGGLTLTEIKEYMNDLNYYHSINNTGFRFYLRPDIEYINNDRLYKLNYISQAPFQSMLKKSKGCINVLVTEKLIKKNLFKADNSYSGTYNRLSNAVIYSKGSSSSTLTHEIGHYFGLKHPHRLWQVKILGLRIKKFQEPVSREKTVLIGNKKQCEKRGDKLCDTPAEPRLSNLTTDDCKYTGWNITDKYGIKYRPSTNNIMSYTRNRECRDTFTIGQIERMLYFASKNKYHKIWSTQYENSEDFDFDYYEPDDNRATASEIFFNTFQTHTFHKMSTSKKKAELEDNIDWLYFNINSKIPQNINISFQKSKYKFSPIRISIYYNKDLIHKTKISQLTNTNTIELKQRKKGTYFIKIEKLTPQNHITGYIIKLAK
jgi:hypothetical protein